MAVLLAAFGAALMFTGLLQARPVKGFRFQDPETADSKQPRSKPNARDNRAGAGGVFEASRPEARYCSGRCRTAAYRTRREGHKPHRPRAPLPDALDAAVNKLHKTTDRLEALTADDRMPRARKSLRTPAREEVADLARRLADVADRLPPRSERDAVWSEALTTLQARLGALPSQTNDV